ncbi:aspartyl-tRNA synthetase [Violaceomyces palustris]|uniref:Aspartyl-tRNA synthetase n=1 Tax=Violaceomyces palustris TaxID=1673888 RepID=A0ACD0P2Z4_9BASI|nr:aspartyl-tRNA synthetase [Violaceomyces palustris]
MLKKAVHHITHDSKKEKGKSGDVSPGSPNSFRSLTPKDVIPSTDVNGHTKEKEKDSKFRLSHIFSHSSNSRPVSRSATDEQSLSSSGSIKKAQRQEEKERKAHERAKLRDSIAIRRQESDLRALQVETPEQRARYGTQYPQEWNKDFSVWDDIALLEKDRKAGDTVTLRARIHTIRDVSSHLVFIVLRQQISTLQAVLAEDGEVNTGHMVRWAKRLPLESIVLVRGVLQKPKEPITGASISHTEVKVQGLYLIAENKETLPFNVYDADLVIKHKDDSAEHSEEEGGVPAKRDDRAVDVDGDHEHSHEHDVPVLTQRTRLANRIIDLRTPTAQAIFRVNAGICSHFRGFLDSQGFVEVHTPKLQAGASESGASVFSVDYFGRPACLAQSPQLFKQMCIAADFKRVYEIGPVFRAENSNTPRHLTEYTGLDIEMEIVHYYDAMKLIDAMLKHIFKNLKEKFVPEMTLIKRHFPCEDLVWLDETLILPFADGVKLLVESGWKEEDGSLPKEDEDLSTRSEIRLGELVKEKFHTDYYILDKFPTSVRPFYAMSDKDKPQVTNSFDIFIRGQEICTGGQRIHEIDALEAKMHKLQISSRGMEDYLEGFRLGAPPHAGCGIGLERMVMLYLNLGDVRLGSLFHRDPKSLPLVKKPHELRHPEASTNPPPWKNHKIGGADSDPESTLRDLQPLEKLIANYGDSSNTSWLDDRFKLWRDPESGAAIGYSPYRSYAIVVGDPLCDKSQRPRVISSFISFLKREAKLKPVWLMAGHEVEEILGARMNWSTLSCIAEERIYDSAKNPAKHDPEVSRKIRHAKKEGVKIQEFGLRETLPEEVIAECDERIRDWHAGRKGEQVHLTNVRPWIDQEHRIYFVARDADDKVCALVVLTQLSPEHGYQIKWALDFPGAPSGSIEYVILHAIESASGSALTFGASASNKLVAMHGLNGIAIKTLSKAYATVAEHHKLVNKGEFRRKLGAKDEPLYICYPRHGLSPAGIKAIVDFFKEN